MSRKKYVVESAFESISVQKIMQIAIDANGRIVNWTDSAENIKELNSDYVNENFGGLQDDAYQRGLDDAWEAARKIAQQWENDTDTEHRVVIDDSIRVTLDSMTASEAIEKLKAYEEQKKADDKIKVRDEVVWTQDENVVIVVTCVYMVNDLEWCDGICRDGKGFHILTKNARKTGRQFDIDKILREMSE